MFSQRGRVAGALVASLATMTTGIGVSVGTASSASAASGSTIVVGGVGQVADYQGAATGFDARITAFNKAGGIDGHKIKFLGMETTGGSFSNTTTLTQNLLSEKHVNVLAPVLTQFFNTSASALTKAAKVPTIGWGVSPTWCKTPYMFSVDGCIIPTGKVSKALGGQLSTYMGSKAKGATVAIVNEDVPSAAASGAIEAAIFKVVGMKVVFNKGIIPTTTGSNLAPYVSQILSTNPGVVFVSTTFANSVAVNAALLGAGYKGVVFSPVGYSEGLLKEQPSVKAALQGTVVDSEMPAAEDKSPAITQIKKDMKLIGKGTEPIGLGTSLGFYDADLLVQMLQNAAAKHKPLTGAGLAAAANAGFRYKADTSGAACSESWPAAHTAGTVGATFMKVNGTQYKLVVPYKCYKNQPFAGA